MSDKPVLKTVWARGYATLMRSWSRASAFQTTGQSKRRKFVIRLVLLMLFSLLSSTVKADTVEVFYNGFWSHSPFPTSVERLRKSYVLHFSISKHSIPEKYQDILEKDFHFSDEETIAGDYVFYLIETNDKGEIIKELVGGKNILFNLTNRTLKRLTEVEKKQLNNYIKDISCDDSEFLPYKKV